MIREVCLFDKFSFCKNGVRCLRIHLKEVCQNRECDYKKCNKRHPRPCRIFRMNGFCKFGASCRYSHRQPKEVEEQKNKIELIEKVNTKLLKQVDDQNEVNTKLLKQVEDQNVEIKKLKGKLLEIESREVKNLQNQINDLVNNNNEKEKALKKLRSDLEWLVNKCLIEEQDDSNDDEDENEEIKNPVYVQNALEYADSAYRDIEKLRKNSREAKNIFQELSKKLSDVPFVVGMSQLFQEEVSRIQSLSKSTEAKLDKESCILEIERFKKQLQTVDRRYCL